MTRESSLVEMQEILNQLNIPLTVYWEPDSNKTIHGEINQNVIRVYDTEENEAFATFVHEIIEFKLRDVTRVYREMVNSLINGYEKLAYHEKEKFIEFIPRLIDRQNVIKKT